MKYWLQSSKRSGPLRPCLRDLKVGTELMDQPNELAETFGLVFLLDRFRTHAIMLPLVVTYWGPRLSALRAAR